MGGQPVSSGVNFYQLTALVTLDMSYNPDLTSFTYYY